MSVMNQSRKADEVIVIDDGSTDDSLRVLERISLKFPKILIHSQPNGGQLAAVRSGIEQATGNWIFFLDADDEWLPDHLFNAHKILKHHIDVSVFFSGHRESNGPPLYRSKWPNGAIGPCSGLVAATGTRVGTIESTLGIRCDLARKIMAFDRLIDQKWRMRAEDCLIFGASLSGAISFYHSDQTVIYRIHGKNSFANTNQNNNSVQYNSNKDFLFDVWFEKFKVDINNLDELIYHEWKLHKHNQKNHQLSRRSARILFRSSKSRLKNIIRALEVLISPYFQK